MTAIPSRVRRLRLCLAQEDQGMLNFYTQEFLYLQIAKKPKSHHRQMTSMRAIVTSVAR